MTKHLDTVGTFDITGELSFVNAQLQISVGSTLPTIVKDNGQLFYFDDGAAIHRLFWTVDGEWHFKEMDGFDLLSPNANDQMLNEFWGNETVISLKVVSGSGLDGYIDRSASTAFHNMSVVGSVYVTEPRFNGGNSGLWFPEGNIGYLIAQNNLHKFFNGTDDPITVVAVFEPAITASGQLSAIASMSYSANDSHSQIFCGTNNQGQIEFFRRNNNSTANVLMLAGTIDYGQIQCVTWLDTGASGQIWKNGVEQTAGPSGTSVGSLSTANVFTIGAQDLVTDATYFDGAILEVAIFSQALSDKQRQAVENKMMVKWGLA